MNVVQKVENHMYNIKFTGRKSRYLSLSSSTTTGCHLSEKALYFSGHHTFLQFSCFMMNGGTRFSLSVDVKHFLVDNNTRLIIQRNLL